MEKKLSGWGNNKFTNSKVYFPNNITEIKSFIKGKTIARGLGRSYGDSSIQPNSTIITTKLKLSSISDCFFVKYNFGIVKRWGLQQ